MKRAYCAGPMRGYEKYNFPAFDAAVDVVKAMGYHPVSPADIDRLFEGWGGAPPEGIEFGLEDAKRFIRRDLNFLLELSPENGDAIFMMRGWERSSGARLEFAMARFLGLEVIYE